MKKWSRGSGLKDQRLLLENDWPDQPELKSSSAVNSEFRPMKETVFHAHKKSDEWEQLLVRKTYWQTLRTTAWGLRFVTNFLAKIKKGKPTKGQLTTEEISNSRDYWERKEQHKITEIKQTPSMIMWGKNCHTLEGTDGEENDLTKMQRRLSNAIQHVWQRWKKEYLHSLMGVHCITKSNTCIPKLGEIVLVLGEEKNRSKWKRGSR